MQKTASEGSDQVIQFPAFDGSLRVHDLPDPQSKSCSWACQVILSLFGFDHGSSRVRGIVSSIIVTLFSDTMTRSGLAVEVDKLVGRVGVYY